MSSIESNIHSLIADYACRTHKFVDIDLTAPSNFGYSPLALRDDIFPAVGHAATDVPDSNKSRALIFDRRWSQKQLRLHGALALSSVRNRLR